MFGIGYGELAVLLILGVVLVGPDRLPNYARDAARLLQRLRAMADDATKDLREEMGPEFKDLDPRALHPKALIQKHIIDPAFGDEDLSEFGATTTPVSPSSPPVTGRTSLAKSAAHTPAAHTPAAPQPPQAPADARWDADAT